MVTVPLLLNRDHVSLILIKLHFMTRIIVMTKIGKSLLVTLTRGVC